MDYEEYERYEPEETGEDQKYEEYEGEYQPEVELKTTKIKAGALFPEDCPMDDKILKSESALYAKSILKTISTENGTSLYDHLCTIVRQLIDERVPGNTVDFIEEISAQTKLKRYGMVWKDPDSTWKELTKRFLSDSDNFLKVWKTKAMWSSRDTDDEPSSEYPNLLKTQYYLEHINFGFQKEEAYRIALSMKNFLNSNRNVQSPRFWGKILCSKKNYYVIEAAISESSNIESDMWFPPRDTSAESESVEELNSEGNAEKKNSFPTLSAEATLERAGKAVTNPEILSAYQTKPKDMGISDSKPPSHMQLFPAEEEMMGEDAEFYGEGGSFRRKLPDDSSKDKEDNRMWEKYHRELIADFPKAVQFLEPPEIPAERQGSGVNRRAFYVCNDLNENWILLPLVTPQHINGSRAIRWALTGDLNASIHSYPSFPGREANYLRALLARITAGTSVSPRGFYKSIKAINESTDEEDISETEEEEDDEEITRQVYGNDETMISTNFRMPSIRNLLASGGFGWVHHACNILRQGRAVWWSSKSRTAESDGVESELDDEEEGESSEYEFSGREIPIPLFISLNKDTYPDNLSPWSVRSSSEVFTEIQMAGIFSNVWPGAVAYCTQKGKMENVYIGDALKFTDRAWAPHFTDIIQAEYPEGPELRELSDPPIEIEQDWLNAIIEAEVVKRKKIEDAKHIESYYDENMEEDFETSEEEEMGETTEEEG